MNFPTHKMMEQAVEIHSCNCDACCIDTPLARRAYAKLKAAQQSVQADGFVAVPNSNLEVNQILDAKAVVIRRR
jgi:hypothetical protein